jgi:hypothetical protein
MLDLALWPNLLQLRDSGGGYFGSSEIDRFQFRQGD